MVKGNRSRGGCGQGQHPEVGGKCGQGQKRRGGEVLCVVKGNRGGEGATEVKGEVWSRATEAGRGASFMQQRWEGKCGQRQQI